MLFVKSKHPFYIVFIIAVLVRAILNFSVPLVPGLGGGYNLVQIRAILEGGHLALPDMPLLFYLNAMIIKVLLLFFPGSDAESMIIIVSKFIDSVGFPLLLYPMYLIQKNIFRQTLSNVFLLAIGAFSVLSYAPLDLACDAQKNSLGLVLMTFFIYYFLGSLEYHKGKDILFSLLFLILTALTHFGVFFITLCFLVIALIVYFRWKAALPVIVAFAIGMLLVGVFDPGRALSMVTFWQEAFSIFVSPRLMYYPFGVLNFIFSFLLAWFMVRVLRKRRSEMKHGERNVLLLLLFFIIILAFPFYGFEYGRRLGLMLFIPQSLALLFLYPFFSKRAVVAISYVVLCIVVLSVSLRLIYPKPMAITAESYADMQQLKNEIKDPGSTIIFARHGLEWWIAWEHRVKIASPHIEINEALKQKYDQIFFLVQKKGENLIYPGQSSIFQKPMPPENTELVYDSEYFQMYTLNAD